LVRLQRDPFFARTHAVPSLPSLPSRSLPDAAPSRSLTLPDAPRHPPFSNDDAPPTLKRHHHRHNLGHHRPSRLARLDSSSSAPKVARVGPSDLQPRHLHPPTAHDRLRTPGVPAPLPPRLAAPSASPRPTQCCHSHRRGPSWSPDTMSADTPMAIRAAILLSSLPTGSSLAPAVAVGHPI